MHKEKTKKDYRIEKGFNYDLIPNKFLSDIVKYNSNISQSMGYPAWNLLYYAVLCSLPRERNEPVVIVETGTNIGLGTIILAQALADSGCKGNVYTVDIEPRAEATENVRSSGLGEYVTFSAGDSIDFLRSFHTKIDFAFLDSDHSFEHVIQEFIKTLRHLRKDGTVYFDNANSGGVKKALDWIQDMTEGNLIRFPYCSWYPPGNAIWQPSKKTKTQI